MMWQEKQRALDFALRRLFLQSLRRGVTGPKVLANSIPKSGTHLLVRCLSLMPDMMHSGFIINYKKVDDRQIATHLKRSASGAIVQSHLPHSAHRQRLLMEHGFKCLLMIRDPRDVVVSHFYYATHKKQSDRFTSIANDDLRVLTAIKGDKRPVDSHISSLSDINSRYHDYLRWRDAGSCVVRFENLVGPKGGGTIEKQYGEIRLIADHLGIPLSGEQVGMIADRLFDRQSKTFRKGHIGGWRAVFTPTHKEAFKDVAGQLLIDLGYEDGWDW